MSWRFPFEQTTESRVRGLRREVEPLKKRGPQKWVALTPINGWADASGTEEGIKYRRGLHWELEFEGGFDGSSSTDPIAGYLDSAYWPDFDRRTTVPMKMGTGLAIPMQMTVAAADGAVSFAPMQTEIFDATGTLLMRLDTDGTVHIRAGGGIVADLA